MKHQPTITPVPGMPYKIGDEATNERCLIAIRRLVEDTGDKILHPSTFDFGNKVMALTLHGVIVADERQRDFYGQPMIGTVLDRPTALKNQETPGNCVATRKRCRRLSALPGKGRLGRQTASGESSVGWMVYELATSELE